MLAFLSTKAGQIMVVTGWFFLLAAIGYGLYMGKIDYTFFGPIITALLGVFGYHFVATKGPGKTNGVV